jgi:hypothetical protein
MTNWRLTAQAFIFFGSLFLVMAILTRLAEV